MLVKLTLSSERNLLAHLSWGLKYTQALMQGLEGWGRGWGREGGRVAASWRADIEQLSRPRRQMSAYNCTRPQNNRNSVRCETTRRTRSPSVLAGNRCSVGVIRALGGVARCGWGVGVQRKHFQFHISRSSLTRFPFAFVQYFISFIDSTSSTTGSI